MHTLARSLIETTEALIPRLLTQVCRDPHSPCHGCFDRDWWHYRIRDFPSIILQQGGYTAWLAARLPAFAPRDAELKALAAAACRFWNRRAARLGAFEEYYPFEEGYPPLAFSTLAVAKLAADGAVSAAEIEHGARLAARQLLSRFEPQAANQQIAGLAALAWLRRLFPALVPDAAFAALADRSLALQTDEGWFVEYGGPDLGYLSVTLDCLWDLHDATSDERYVAAAAAGLGCIVRYVSLLGGGIGMHNARNTDYILPYGIARFAVSPGPHRASAGAVLRTLYSDLANPAHFLRAMDDRYLSHYAGHSLVRAALVLAAEPSGPASGRRGLPGADLGTRPGGQALDAAPGPACGTEGEPAASAAPPDPAAGGDRLLPLSGHYLRPRFANRTYSAILSLRKGGILTAVAPGARLSDFGWVVMDRDRQYVSHWWSDSWQWTRAGDTVTVQGPLAPHREPLSTPMKHALLRIASFCLGRRVIGPLKNALIFKKGLSGPAFRRNVSFDTAAIVVSDRIEGLDAGADIRPAPRSSKRHVASADTFHAEDLRMADGVRVSRTTRFENGVFEAKTIYTFSGVP